MFPSRLVRMLVPPVGLMVAAAVAVAVAVGGLQAGEPSSEASVAKLGLKTAGTVLVLDAEAGVREKAQEVRRLARELNGTVMRQRGTLSAQDYQDTLKELNAEIGQFRAETNTVNQTMRQIPKYRGRFTSTDAAEQYNELNVYKNQLQWEINQRTAFLNQLKSHPYDPKAKQKIDSEVRDQREALHQAVQDMRRSVTAIEEKYEALANEAAVKKVLETSEKKTGIPLKLGPSRQFHLEVKFLEKLEQNANGDSDKAPAKPSRKAHRATKGKRSSKAAASPGNSGSPF